MRPRWWRQQQPADGSYGNDRRNRAHEKGPTVDLLM
jgi:hypothetical protein